MMKVKEIIKLLRENKDIDAYEINRSEKQSSELFFVLKKLEINRATNTESISITVYVDQKDKRGSSTVLVTSADDEKTLKTKLKEAVKKAKTALNPYFELAKKQENINKKIALKESLNDTALKVAKAIMKADHYKKGWINSTEIFVSKNKLEFYNSNGVKHSEEKLSIEFEIIPTWTNGTEEFETYKYYKSNRFSSKEITESVEDVLSIAKDRSKAKTIKDVDLPNDLPILMTGEMADYILNAIKSETSYQKAYTHTSHYNVKDVVSNNRFDLTLKANIAGVSNSHGFDRNGIVLSSKKLISKGVLKDTYGDIRYGYYLKKDNVSGEYSIASLKADGVNYKKTPHIIIEHFSSPQIDETGYFGGEVRLARYYDGKKYIPLTSFSVSGNLYEALKDVEFSKEQTTTSKYKGPKYFIFHGMKIS